MAYMVSYAKRRMMAVFILLIVCGTVLLEVFALGIATVVSLNLQDHSGVIRNYDTVMVPVLMEILSVFHFLVAAYEVEGWLLYRRRLIKEVCDVTKRLKYQLFSSYVVTGLIGIAFVSIVYGLFTASTALQFTLRKYMRHYRTNVRMKDKLDQLQIVFGCCGNRNYRDWFKLPWINRHYRKYIPATYDRRNRGDNAPFSCCNPSAKRQCIHYGVLTQRLHYKYNPMQDLTLYRAGCSQVVTLYLKEMYFGFLGHLVLVLMFKVADICLSRLIYTSHIEACQSGNPQATTPGYICRRPSDQSINDELQPEEKAPSVKYLDEKAVLEATVSAPCLSSVSSCLVIPHEVKVRPCSSHPVQPPPPYPWPEAPAPIAVPDALSRAIPRSTSETVPRSIPRHSSETIRHASLSSSSQRVLQSCSQIISGTVPRTILQTDCVESQSALTHESQQTEPTNGCVYKDISQTRSTQSSHVCPRPSTRQDFTQSNDDQLEDVCSYEQRFAPNQNEMTSEFRTAAVQTSKYHPEIPTDTPNKQDCIYPQATALSFQHVCPDTPQRNQVFPMEHKFHTCRTTLQQELDSEIHRFARTPPFIGDPLADDYRQYGFAYGQQLHVCPTVEHTDNQTTTCQTNAIPCVLYRSENSDVILCTKCSTIPSREMASGQEVTHSCLLAFRNTAPPPPPPPPPPFPTQPPYSGYNPTAAKVCKTETDT